MTVSQTELKIFHNIYLKRFFFFYISLKYILQLSSVTFDPVYSRCIPSVVHTTISSFPASSYRY